VRILTVQKYDLSINMDKQRSIERHPFSSLMLLLLLILIGAVVFTAIAMSIGALIYSKSSFQDLISSNNLQFQKFALALTSVGMFIFPALVFAYLENRNVSSYLKLNKPSNIFSIALAIMMMITATPFIEWSVMVNEGMKLPSFLQGLENWMRLKENELAELTKNILVMKSITALLINLLIIAVIPALGEEFTFRGCIQKLFTLWAKNYHVGIWIAAIIFSTIHFQFYGFLPRMLLGALFGYIFVWTGSIWAPVVAHFYNNASAVIAAYALQKQGKSLDSLSKPEDFKWYVILISIILTSLLLWQLYKLHLKRINYNQHD
jgi:hypothetical protein